MYTDEELDKIVQCSLKNHEFFRQNRVGLPKSFEQIQAAATSNILHIPQLLGGDRVSSI